MIRKILCAVALAFAASDAAAAERYDCLIEPSSRIELAAASAGVLKAVHVDRGEPVAEGQVVAELVDDVQSVDVEIAKLRAEDKSEVRARRIRSSYERRKVTRQGRLAKRGVVSKQVLEDARTELALAEAELAIAEMRQRQLAAESARAEALLRLRRVVSPIDGVVVQRLLGAGEFASDDEPVLVIAAVDPLYVETFLPLEALGKVAAGTNAAIFPEGPVGGEYQATVSAIDPVMDAASGTFGVRLILPNTDRRALAGLRCSLEFLK